MEFAFTEEQEALRRTARDFLAEHSPPARVRAAMASEHGHDAEAWKRLSADLGWTAVALPEDCGGLGLSWVELAALCEAAGGALLCAPFFATTCLAAPALALAASPAQRREHGPALAEGRRTAALAFPGPGGRWDPGGVEVEWRGAGAGYALDGVARHVVDGCAADLLVVPARRAGSAGDEGLALFAVPAATPGVARRALPGMDRTRRLAELRFAGAALPAEALLGDAGAGAAALARALDLAAVALAAEQVGGAQRCLDLAVAHAKERVQFGRPIGSFQAVKHTCADMMVRVEAARSAVYYAACAAAEAAAELPLAASLAKATASEAFFRCAADALQVHGGVGFTWEVDVHLYLKRARAGLWLLGEPAWHRERVARHLLGPAS
jgi:alkylation response protein AidB-like acyl-CoA dehydrogenase